MNKSFTLIEILVVIVVIGILSAFILVGISSVTNSANIAKGKAFSNSLRNSLLMSIMSEWKIDDVSGTGANDNKSNINGTIQGLTNTSAGYGDNNTSGWMSATNCISGTCLKFNGSQSISFVSSFPAIGDNSFTWEAWGKTQVYDSSRAIIRLSVAGITNWNGRLNFPHSTSNKALMYVRNSCYRYSSTIINDNKWHHVVGVMDRSKTTPDIYVDGKIDNYGTGSSAECSTIGSIPAGELTLGYSSYNGGMDEIKMYNEAVPVSRIAQNYYTGLNNLFINNNIGAIEYMEKIAQF
ncbi:MAG TPA: prepilin-type N-terminal cleavage/methylation domain-containing protein [Candidatus Pacearchaeota archaeon]|nr:prepilin-type N-terminal cleavage/methylation domain-containing protein [Candidatus Pacearchaeota archaeon]HQM24358.1 prepilin-type N-terminal cleavage/methylation domain-containing protein [Candidatus Pacearchaeota archaeon]